MSVFLKPYKGPLSSDAFFSGQLFLDPSRLTGQISKIVELGLTNVATAFDLDTINQLAIGLKNAFNPFAVGNFTYGES